MDKVLHKRGLVKDFQEVAARFKQQLPGFFSLAAGPHIPFAEIEAWKRISAQNCYNYARNTASETKLQPGDLAPVSGVSDACDDVDFPDVGAPVSMHPLLEQKAGFVTPRIYDYSQDILRRLELDGNITWAGFDLSAYFSKGNAEQKGWCTALFFKSCLNECDYHWYAVRRSNLNEAGRPLYGFAEKKGTMPARWVAGNDIFEDARENGYRYFAGFFHVNPA